jgi:serine/threonine-protein kinase
MGRPSGEKVLERARDLGLLDERQMREVWASFATHRIPLDDLLQMMVRREFLTNYQIERLMRGDSHGFFFGDYKVQYLVGSGSFARVYRSVHRTKGEVRAVKVLRNRFSDNSQASEQFVREGRVGLALRHPNIVPIYEVHSDGRQHFLVMDFVEGRSLREFVKIRGKLEPKEAVRLVTDIADGLAYAFERGLTHRDMKMSNVLVSSRGDARLVDFGLAAIDESVSGSDSAEMANPRTVDYAALERVTGVRNDDTRSDIFFLGCIFYNMLMGEPPLSETRERVQRLSKQRFLDVVPIHKADPAIPECVSMIVNKAMVLDPTHRYQSPSAMLDDLKALAGQDLSRLPEEVVKKRAETATTGRRSHIGKKPKGKKSKSAISKSAHAIMVVESNTTMQDIFREGFKRAGFRVLLIGDPHRAVERLRQDPHVAECVILNAQETHRPALEGFNALADDPKLTTLPAILLLAEEQHKWEEEAKTAPHRICLPMPITMKILRANIAMITAMQSAARK